MGQAVIQVSNLKTQFGRQVVHDGVDLTVESGEVLAIVGGSGTGKSVLLRDIIGLVAPTAGHIEVLGRDLATLNEAGLRALQERYGVLFQDGALFSSLTVAQNIQVPLKEHITMPARLRAEISDLKINMVGLPLDAANKYPAELSGGMRKRAGLARALALDPDPVSRRADRGPRPDRRGQVRSAHPQPAARARPDRGDGDPRPRQPSHGCRPHCGACRQTC